MNDDPATGRQPVSHRHNPLTSCRSMRHGIERPLPGHAYIGNRFLKVFAFDAENSTPEANQ